MYMLRLLLSSRKWLFLLLWKKIKFITFYSLQGRSSLHLTHVTFSPNGEEVLLSYSGEHVYLMNVNSGMFPLYSSYVTALAGALVKWRDGSRFDLSMDKEKEK